MNTNWILIRWPLGTQVRLTWLAPLANQQNGDLLGYKIFLLATSQSADKEEMEVCFFSCLSLSHLLVSIELLTGSGSTTTTTTTSGGAGVAHEPLAAVHGHVHRVPHPDRRLQSGRRRAALGARHRPHAAGHSRTARTPPVTWLFFCFHFVFTGLDFVSTFFIGSYWLWALDDGTR